MPAKKCTKVDENVIDSTISDTSGLGLETTEEEIVAAETISLLGDVMSESSEQHNGIGSRKDESVQVYSRYICLFRTVESAHSNKLNIKLL